MSDTPRKLKRLEGASYIPISDIIINRSERIRRDPAEVKKNAEAIADSLILVGPISPILLNESNELIAGECRLEAYKLLEQTEVPFVRRIKLERAMELMIELDENTRRKEMCWQDKALAIAAVHDRESTKIDPERKKAWGLRATGELVGQSHSYVADCLIIARALKQNDKEIWDAKSFDQAKQIFLSRKEQAATAALAKQSADLLVIPQPPKAARPTGIISIQLGTTQPLPQSVIQASPEQIREMRAVKLSDRLFNMDCVELMKNVLAPSSIDAVITDIPYGIDMDLMEDMHGIDKMRSTHDVQQNVEQMKPFLEGAFRVLKDNTYLFFFFAQQHQEKLATWGAGSRFLCAGLESPLAQTALLQKQRSAY